MSLFTDLHLLDKEIWLATRLRIHGEQLFDGLTTYEMRKARARDAILRLGPERVAGYKDRYPVTFAQAFERIYHVALIPTVPATGTEDPPAQTARDATAPT